MEQDPEGTFVVDRSAVMAAASAQERAHFLVSVGGPNQGRRFEVPAGGLTLGRSDQADVSFKDGSTSKLHCRVEPSGTSLKVVDLNSTNGTFVDGRRVAGDGAMAPESLLEIGEHALKFEYRDRAEVRQSELITGELRDARDYLMSCFPAPFADGELRVDWAYVPSSLLGGDVFGYHALDESRMAIYLLDVSGHGVSAAMHGISAVNSIRQQSLIGADFGAPASALAALNDVFQMDHHGGMYFTIWYGVFDRRDGSLEYSSAGHPPALLVAPDSIRELKTKGPGIGLFPGYTYQSARAQTAAGDRLFVFSDGVFEVRLRDGRDWSLRDLVEQVALLPPGTAAPALRIREIVEDMTGHSKWEDDFSLVAAGILGPANSGIVRP